MRLLFFVTIFFIVQTIIAQTSVHWSSAGVSSTYLVGEKSELTLKGKTNVNSFECECENEFPASTFKLKKDESQPNSFLFSNTFLTINIYSLNCGNALMNKDLQKALNAKHYPNIQIHLIRAKYNKCHNLKKNEDWIKMKAFSEISLNGNKNEYWIDITAKKISANHYRFIGTKKLFMTDFCVEPPTALMGMVKVSDEISISFDLEIKVE